MSAPDLTTQLQQAGIDPATVTVDGQSVTVQDPAKLILLQQFLQGQAAMANPNRGIRFSKLLPPGAASDQGGTLFGKYPGSGC